MNKVVHLDQKIVWVDGKPIAKYTEIINKEAIADLPLAVLGLKYKREQLEIELGIDAEFEGMTNAEVMFIRLARQAAHGGKGSGKAATALLDRVLGKPKTSAEVKSVSINYKDYLQQLGETLDAEDENSL
jgi:hypothetical protein